MGHLFLLAGAALLAAPSTLTIEWAGEAAREDLARDRFVVHDSKTGALRLTRSYLIAHTPGKSVKRIDDLGATGAARVCFDVASTAVAGAVLYLYGEGEGGDLEVNGRAVEAPDARGHAGWAGRELAAGVLRAGRNEFVFRRARLAVDELPPGSEPCCERSFDGGRTFRKGALGPRGDWVGEYLVRLRVRSHPPRGSVLSEAVDLRAAAGGAILAAVRPLRLRLAAEAATPEGTSIRFQARLGQEARFPAPASTDWIEVEPGRVLDPPPPAGGLPWRFLQWRAELASARGDRTPELRGLRIDVEAEVEPPGAAGITVVEFARPRFLPTFYPFTHEGDGPRVRLLRQRHGLEGALGPEGCDLDRLSRLRAWVSAAWVESWDSGKLGYIPPWDALELLDLAPRGLSMGMCTHKGVAYAQCAAAVGYPARVLIVSGHALAEVWSNDLERWVLQDPGPGLTPDRTRTLGCRYDLDGAPARALDLLRAGAERATAVPEERDRGLRAERGVWCGTYDRFAIPLRNDHLSRPEPAEEEHGFGHYRYDGYLWWSGDLDDPRYGEYSLLSNREADFYPALNVALVDLEAESPGVLRVALRSETPGLARYRVWIGGEESARGEEPFAWRLKAGENRLEVRAENGFGVAGPARRVVLRYDP